MEKNVRKRLVTAKESLNAADKVTLNDRLKDALIKRAIGGETQETVDEYVNDGLETCLRLMKRKVSTKYNPPDVSAVKALLELSGQDISAMTDAELIAERDRIISEFKNGSEEKNEN